MVINDLRKAGYTIFYDGDYVCAQKYGYTWCVPKDKEVRLYPLSEPIEEWYRFKTDIVGVVDVGANIGDTPIYFRMWGYKPVIAYEPEVCDILQYNIQRNKVDGIVPICKGVGKFSGEEPWEDVLERARDFGIKVDCEGCEWWLLGVDCEKLRLAREWIAEVHGFNWLLKKKFEHCGFSTETINERSGGLVSILRWVR